MIYKVFIKPNNSEEDCPNIELKTKEPDIEAPNAVLTEDYI